MKTKVWLRYLLTLICICNLAAEPATPAVGTAERKSIMDVLRSLPAVEKHAASAKAPIIFKVHKLLVEGRLGLAEVTPMVKDASKTFPKLLVFLRRGGDEPWDTVISGNADEARQANDGWVGRFFANGQNEEFKALWGAYNHQPSANETAQAVATELDEGVADWKAILKVVSSQPLISSMSKDLKKKIILGEVVIKKGGTWAWIVANPRTADRTWQGESLVYLLRQSEGRWKIVSGIPEDVVTAEQPEAAYRKWRSGLLKKNPSLPPALIPTE